MSSATESLSSFGGASRAANGVWAALIVFAAYILAAEAAFFIGTLSDKIFAPFWPPNIVLLGALLAVAPARRWLVIAAALPAHLVAEFKIGMSIPATAVAFATNVLIASVNVIFIERLLGAAPWFSDFRKTSIFVLGVGFLTPAAVAFGGAFVPLLAGGELPRYWVYWEQWFASNVIGSLTLAPFVLILLSQGGRTFWADNVARRIEAGLLAMLLVVVSYLAFAASAGRPHGIFLPAVLYSPVPLIFWAAGRFGAPGASAAILIVTVVLIWKTLNGPSLFAGVDPEENVIALQVFLASLAVPTLLLGASIDATRRAERKKREDEARMAFVAATANVGLWSYDAGSRQLWATGHCRRMLGLPNDAPPTLEAYVAAVLPEDQPKATGMLCGQTRFDQPVEFRLHRQGGEVRWMVGRATPQLRDGKLTGTSGAIADITDRKVAQAEADLQRRELAHLMRVSQVGELSSGLAHELTQPLTAILSNAQAAKMLLADPNGDKSELSIILDDIIAEDGRAGQIIHRLRSLLRKGESNFEAIDVNELVASTMHLLHSEAISRRVDLRHDVSIVLPTVRGDRIQLQQVLLNLCMNAMDAMDDIAPERRSLRIGTSVRSDEVEMCVTDRGTGLSNAVKESLFTPFFTTKKRGLGLGLSICSSIVRAHGGTLTLRNNLEGGASASVRLPAQEI